MTTVADEPARSGKASLCDLDDGILPLLPAARDLLILVYLRSFPGTNLSCRRYDLVCSPPSTEEEARQLL